MSESQQSPGGIFDAAIELPKEERAAFLEKVCSGDAPLRKRVEALLRAHDVAGAFMDSPAMAPEARTVAAGPKERLGDRIGRYKLQQQIGEGGCGVVYMAEQQEPVRRQVALKVIKLGMDTKSVIARFEAERQALALMDHPNIAKVLDAGATEMGRPYFVMELVRGIKITSYCDQNNLSTRQRLDLFIQVCQAVQHAHQKGIIHRDIKPSNILVTLRDGVPVPKVIDFGIAKATSDQRLTDKTLFTAFEQFIGTPAYMSPEQAETSELGIDTRSDIYSLGVLLYELLTGQTPFDSNKLLRSGLDEIRRIIREEEPPRPSTRLSTMMAADLTEVAKHRQMEPVKLSGLVRGELDWIVMKALEKDRTRRYETANGLGRDVEHYLADEPVVARPSSNLYRFQKLVRRNKLAFGAAAVLAAVLLGATGISAWQALRATRAQTLASQRLVESEAISKFLTEVFQSADPARDGRTITVAESLGAAAKKVETDLASQPARRAKLQATLGATYFALGLYREAIPLQEKVRDYYLAVSGPEHTNTLTAMHSLANTYGHAARGDEALKLREQVLALRRKVLGPEHPATLSAMHSLAISYAETGRPDVALKLFEEVLALSRKVNGPEHPTTLAAMQGLGNSYANTGRPDVALKLLEEVLALSRKVNGPEHPATLVAMTGLVYSRLVARRWDEALKLSEAVVALQRKVTGPEHPATLAAMENLADSYHAVGRLDEALKMKEQVLTLRQKVLGPEHPDTLRAMEYLAHSYGDAGRRDEMLKLREQLLALRRKLSGPEHRDTLDAMVDRANAYDQADRRDDALKLREEVLTLRRKVSGLENAATAEAMENLAASYCSIGHHKEAMLLLEQVSESNPRYTLNSLMLATCQTWFGQDAEYEATRRRLIQQAEGTHEAGTAEQAAKACCLRPSTDTALLGKALSLARQASELGKSSPSRPWFHLGLGLAEYRNGQYSAAEKTLAVAEQTVTPETVNQRREIQGTARLFRAMSLFRQDRPEEARKLFSQAEAQIPPLPKDESKPLVAGETLSHDVVIGWLAYKEAKALIEGPPAPGVDPSVPK